MKTMKTLFNNITNWVKNSPIWEWFYPASLYLFILKVFNVLKTSTLAFSFFILLGNVSFAFTRYFCMWWFDCWQYLFFYYCSVTFPFVVSLILIFFHYIQNTEPVARMDKNSQKWNAYFDHIIETHNIAFIFKKRRG